MMVQSVHICTVDESFLGRNLWTMGSILNIQVVYKSVCGCGGWCLYDSIP